MNNFITLTKNGGVSILVNPLMIQAIEPSPAPQAKSTIYMMAGTSWMVMETVDEIRKKITEATYTKITTYETGPR